ncbi:MAG: crystallin J1 [Planctomycetota bacterium]|nr:MAG: crystallin J1 [Planctomycetota bacterium]
MSMPDDHNDRLRRALSVLHGLSVGDAFGQQFFTPGIPVWCINQRRPPPPVWRYTDDSEMAIGIVEILSAHGRIDQDALAIRFGERFAAEPARGYGPAAIRILHAISQGESWRTVGRSAFGGTGSFGNGSAMRVAPIGAYFCSDLNEVVAQAAASAEITHAHEEGIAGAIAIAVATAWCCRQPCGKELSGKEMLDVVRDHTPRGPIRLGIEEALGIELDAWEFTAASLLGNGSRITARDTVPFCLWSAAAHLDSFTDAMWATMRVEGDVDTNCAIVGGIVAAANGTDGVPVEWIDSRERLQIVGIAES